ncbi:MAG: hypothetical protein ACYTG6_08230, partial [Planctomycetota bacterium]
TGDAAALAAALAGSEAPSDADWFPPPTRRPDPKPVWAWFLVAALALLPIDVALHRRSVNP